MSKKIRIAINGFGRIGRLAFRKALEIEHVNIVAINSVIPSECSYLLKNDSIHGRLNRKIEYGEDWISVDGHKVVALRERDPSKLPWKDLQIDTVLECTGVFTTMDKASMHLSSGAKFVVVSAPSKDIPMFVLGVNDESLQPGQRIISNASCTTNCFGPLVYILDQEFGIEEGFMSTIHSVTATQKTVDVCMKGRDRRRGRTIMNNIIPTTTGADAAVSIVYPKIAGKLKATSYRVPVSNVSMVDFVVKLEKPCESKKQMDELMKKMAKSERFEGIFGFCDESLVSSDFVHDSRSSIYDSHASVELSKQFYKIVAWYDNEWGYVSRLLQLASVQVNRFLEKEE